MGRRGLCPTELRHRTQCWPLCRRIRGLRLSEKRSLGRGVCLGRDGVEELKLCTVFGVSVWMELPHFLALQPQKQKKKQNKQTRNNFDRSEKKTSPSKIRTERYRFGRGSMLVSPLLTALQHNVRSSSRIRVRFWGLRRVEKTTLVL